MNSDNNSEQYVIDINVNDEHITEISRLAKIIRDNNKRFDELVEIDKLKVEYV